MTIARPTIDFSIPAMRVWRKIPEGVIAEVIYGKLYVSPNPTPYHQDTSASIFLALANHVRSNDLGKVYFAPLGVYLLHGTNALEPDVLFISKDNPSIIDRRGLHGPPDLCIEVLSPSTRKRDLTIKKSLYEQAGVKEYWIVDPDTREAHGYLLKEGVYGNPLVMKSKIYVRILKRTIRL